MSMEKMEFDPTLEANKARKDLKKEQAVKSAELTLEESVYNPKTGKYDLVEDLSFAKDEGHIILRKGNGEDIKTAKAQILPMNTLLEMGKEKLKEESSDSEEEY